MAGVIEEYNKTKRRKHLLAHESAVRDLETSPHGHVTALIYRAIPYWKTYINIDNLVSITHVSLATGYSIAQKK